MQQITISDESFKKLEEISFAYSTPAEAIECWIEKTFTDLTKQSFYVRTREELMAALQAGIDELDGGKFISGEDAMRQMIDEHDKEFPDRLWHTIE